jgi:hypothetical protein
VGIVQQQVVGHDNNWQASMHGALREAGCRLDSAASAVTLTTQRNMTVLSKERHSQKTGTKRLGDYHSTSLRGRKNCIKTTEALTLLLSFTAMNASVQHEQAVLSVRNQGNPAQS